MAAVFPSSVKIFTSKTDLVDTVLADHVNVLQEEVSAVEGTLGTGLLVSTWTGTYSNPTTHATLTGRLGNIEAGLKSIEASKQDASTAVTLAGSQTLTNKTLTSPTLAGAALSGTLTNGGTISGGTIDAATLTQSGVAVVTVSGTQSLTNKTLTSPTLSGGTLASATTLTNSGTISGGTVNAATLQQGGIAAVTVSGTQVLTNKTIDGGANTLQNIPQSAVSGLSTTISNLSSTYSPLNISINGQTASYTLVLGDASKQVEMNSASSNTLTIPTDAAVNFPVGTSIVVVQTGAGQTTIAGASGVTVNSTPGLKLRTQWSVATLIKRGTNLWLVSGDVIA